MIYTNKGKISDRKNVFAQTINPLISNGNKLTYLLKQACSFGNFSGFSSQ